MGRFDNQVFARNVTIRVHYSTLVYKNMEAVQAPKNVFREPVMAAVVKQFKHRAIDLKIKVKSYEEVLYTI